MLARPKRRKIAVLGSGSVGKSSLIVKFIEGHFVQSYYPSLENTFTKIIRYKGQNFQTEVIDSAESDEFSILRSKHLTEIHGYMFVYSVGSKQSFELVRVMQDNVLSCLGAVPMVVVGNKCDLRVEQRQVDKELGMALADEFGCSWTEASARDGKNVSKAFDLMIGEIEKSKNPEKRREGWKCEVM